MPHSVPGQQVTQCDQVLSCGMLDLQNRALLDLKKLCADVVVGPHASEL